MSSKLAKTSPFLPQLFDNLGFGDLFTELFNYPFGAKESEKDWTFSVDVPGFEEKDLKIELKEDYIIISGKVETNGYLRSINKSTYLGEGLDTDKISAELKNGVLTITIPKKEVQKVEPETKTVQIKVG
jgi:HSP20 family molecular chaperone IbpA